MILFPCQRITAVPIFFVVFRKKLSQQGKEFTFQPGSDLYPFYPILPRCSDLNSGGLFEYIAIRFGKYVTRKTRTGI
jgi:hypothetical protein